MFKKLFKKIAEQVKGNEKPLFTFTFSIVPYEETNEWLVKEEVECFPSSGPYSSFADICYRSEKNLADFIQRCIDTGVDYKPHEIALQHLQKFDKSAQTAGYEIFRREERLTSTLTGSHDLAITLHRTDIYGTEKTKTKLVFDSGEKFLEYCKKTAEEAGTNPLAYQAINAVRPISRKPGLN